MGKAVKNFLQEFSIPLIGGVVVALVLANIDHELYERIIEWRPLSDAQIGGHAITLHFLVNDVFMVLFFGVAAKEITESMLPGGPLNPLRRAINPVLATFGGVLGPALFYVFFAFLAYGGTEHYALVHHGWGIPTATDIALAWLVARIVFGQQHPAVNFLLLLAIADDAIGLAIIAVFYPDPIHPVRLGYLGLVAAGMALAAFLRWRKVDSWVPYVVFGGGLTWTGLLLASLHPALALVFVVPFMPWPKSDEGLFVEEESTTAPRVTLDEFEHDIKDVVDFGLFFFGLANAGVPFSDINALTWVVFGALVVGKVVGISTFGLVACKLGFALPRGMQRRDLFMASLVAALGLTVALFVAGQAFPSDGPWQGPAKMGALMSAVVGVVAVVVGRIVGVKRKSGIDEEPLAVMVEAEQVSSSAH